MIIEDHGDDGVDGDDDDDDGDDDGGDDDDDDGDDDDVIYIYSGLNIHGSKYWVAPSMSKATYRG